MTAESSALLAPPGRFLPLLYEISRALSRQTELRDSLPSIVDSLAAGAGLESCAALVPPPSGGSPVYSALSASMDQRLLGTKAGFGEGLAGSALATGLPQRSTSEAAVPILAGGEVWGLLCARLRAASGAVSGAVTRGVTCDAGPRHAALSRPAPSSPVGASSVSAAPVPVGAADMAPADSAELCSLLEAAAALIAEALGLRRRLSAAVLTAADAGQTAGGPGLGAAGGDAGTAKGMGGVSPALHGVGCGATASSVPGSAALQDWEALGRDRGAIDAAAPAALQHWRAAGPAGAISRAASAIAPPGPADGLFGTSQALEDALSLIKKVAPSEATVLISGESGTGKELAARAIHRLSPRASGPFVAVNCAALPAELIESELFGHEKGAFTGAAARRAGRFELAAGGSIFLDEVSELAPGLQAKLLRVLQERSFERVGSSRPVKADVRVIAASNRDLEREVREGRFRSDLYWRLAVFPLRMPPLRERGGDIVILADHFAESFGASLGRKILRISTPAIDLLMSYHWPGNVRELENVIERAVILSGDGVIHSYNLPPSLQSAESTGTGPDSTLDASLARLERELLVEALKIEKGNSAAAARRLGISERRMGLALKRYGIDWRRFRLNQGK